MSKTIRFTLGTLVLALLLPLDAAAQPKPAPTAPAAPAKPAAAKPLHPANETRWNNLFQAAAVLTHEGMEVHRITAAEKKQIDDYIAQMKAIVAKAKTGGISEAEEDGIDNGLAALFAMVAKNMSDVPRKAAAVATLAKAAAPAKALHPANETRWNNLFQAAAVLTHEGVEVHRITAAEKKQIDDYIASGKAAIAKAKTGGISEAEEDGIDNGIAALFATLAKNMSDVPRKTAAVAILTKAAATAPVAAKALHPANETRWDNLFQAAAVLTNEGMEVQRITAAEKKQIDDSIAAGKAAIVKAKTGGISEAEEDGIDNGIAGLFALIAKSMSDVPRKAAALKK